MFMILLHLGIGVLIQPLQALQPSAFFVFQFLLILLLKACQFSLQFRC